MIAVAGELGRSAAGLTLWSNGIDGFADIRNRHLVPRPPYGQGRLAAEAGALAMTDVSDGLLADLGQLATASGVTMDLDGEALRTDIEAVTEVAGPPGRTPGHGCSAVVRTMRFWHVSRSGRRLAGGCQGGRSGAAEVLLDGAAWPGSPGWQSFD